jgi:hypothetical protein
MRVSEATAVPLRIKVIIAQAMRSGFIQLLSLVAEYFENLFHYA